MARVGRTLLCLLAAGACRPSAPGSGPLPVDTAVTSCFLGGEPVRLPDTLSVGLSEAVDPAHAPAPSNAAEALVFRHLYETLIHVDCAGRATPGLAETWTTPDRGRTWVFTLRSGAQFWDGAPVTAREVVASWGARAQVRGVLAVADDERTVRVTLRSAEAVPRAVADPALAVTKAAPAGGWPIGAGAWWVTPTTAGATTITATPTVPRLPVIDFRMLAGADARDALDAGIDVLVTRDHATLDYAATLRGVPALDLVWDVTYALVVPARSPEGGGRSRRDEDDAGADTTLARALRIEARAPAPPFWWGEVDRCGFGDPPAPPAPAGAGSRRRVVYDRADQPAGELAHRLVALAAGGRWPATAGPELAPGRPTPVAAGLVPAEFAAALRRGTETAYVVALPSRVFDACAAARTNLPPYRARITALVDTRPRALIRRGRSGFVLDWDGTLHVPTR